MQRNKGSDTDKNGTFSLETPKTNTNFLSPIEYKNSTNGFRLKVYIINIHFLQLNAKPFFIYFILNLYF